MSDLLAHVCPAAASFALARGMRVRREHGGTAFGDAMIELMSSAFDLRIVRDRSEISVDISPPDQGNWHRLSDVLAVVGIADSTGSSVQEAFGILSARFEAVSELMASDSGRKLLADFEKARQQTFLNELFVRRGP